MSQPAKEHSNKTGPVYIIDNAGSQSVLSITEWKDPADKNIFHYYIQQNNIKDNSLINKKEIAVSRDKPYDHEKIIGRLGNIFWILTDSLIGYDVHTLEPIITEQKILTANPFIKDSLSNHPNNYLLDELAQVMYFRTENDERYKLYPSGIIKPDDGNNELAPEDYNYEFAANYKLYDRYEIKSALSCIDTSNNTLYILGSKTETGYVLGYFGTAIYPDRKENRQITIVPYHADGEKLDYKKNPPVTGNKSYLQGGFLQNKFCTTAWKNSKGDRLILFLSDNIRQSTISIAMVSKDGVEKWRTDTGISLNNFMDYLLSENNLLIWFKQYQQQKGTIQTVVVNIDLTDGIKSSY